MCDDETSWSMRKTAFHSFCLQKSLGLQICSNCFPIVNNSNKCQTINVERLFWGCIEHDKYGVARIRWGIKSSRRQWLRACSCIINPNVHSVTIVVFWVRFHPKLPQSSISQSAQFRVSVFGCANVVHEKPHCIHLPFRWTSIVLSSPYSLFTWWQVVFENNRTKLCTKLGGHRRFGRLEFCCLLVSVVKAYEN